MVHRPEIVLLGQTCLEPLSEHLGSFAIALFVVGNEFFALVEPLFQWGVILKEVRVEAALDGGGEVSHEDQVSQRNGLGSGKESKNSNIWNIEAMIAWKCYVTLYQACQTQNTTLAAYWI